jgi:hypothetical protein
MLNPWFKSLQGVYKYVDYKDVICFASHHNLKVIIPLLMTCFDSRNLIIDACTFAKSSDELGK